MRTPSAQRCDGFRFEVSDCLAETGYLGAKFSDFGEKRGKHHVSSLQVGKLAHHIQIVVEDLTAAGSREFDHQAALEHGNKPNQRWVASPALTNPELLLDQMDRLAGVKT